MSNNNDEMDFTDHEDFSSGLVELDEDIVKDIQAYMDMDDDVQEDDESDSRRNKVFLTSEIMYYDSDKDYGMKSNNPYSNRNLHFLENEEDDENEDYEEDDNQDYDDGRFDDLDEEPYIQPKQKLSKEQIVNRVMAGMGVAIAAFTIFYGIVAYGIFHNDNKEVKTENESVEQVIQETTTEYIDESLFVSPYSDKNISEEIKEELNEAKLKPAKTKLNKLDNKVDKVMTKVVDSSKSNYDNIRNIYDYLLVNFEYKDKSYVDEDTVYDLCSTVDYESFLDMKIIYRANKSLTNNEGSPDDYACAFTVLARRYGLEAYYIDGAIYNEDGEYESHGYSIIVLDGKNYIFDPAYDALLLKEENDKTKEQESSADSMKEQYDSDEKLLDLEGAGNGYLSKSSVKDLEDSEDSEKESDNKKDSESKSSKGKKNDSKGSEENENDEDADTAQEQTDTRVAPAYMSFGKTFEELKKIYTTDDVDNSMSKFSDFATLGAFSFDASFSTTNGGDAYGSVTYKTGYSEDGNSGSANGEIIINTGEKVYLSGSVSGSSTNTWKLVAKVYDQDMDYVTEATIYSATTYTSENDISYTPGRPGNIKLVYMVTDSYGRTCAISKMITVRGSYYDGDDDDDDDDDDDETTKPTEKETESEIETTTESQETEEPSSEEETTTEEMETEETSSETEQEENPEEPETTEPPVED